MTTRRLTAILAADVAGFSAMMERDEEGTAARIRALRADVIEPALARHHGRLVKTTGDGFLAEFASPVEAVRSALAIQEQLAAANGVSLRIGINLGDIIIEDDGDVLGDGVNVAARLEQMADPGGICISGKIYAEVEGKTDRSFEDRGEQQVKNIARPVRVYALAGTGPSRSEAKAIPLPEKWSIAVLPFANLSEGPDTDYFAEAIVDEITTGLSRFRRLFVVSQSSAFALRGTRRDIRDVGKVLCVRYVLEGSVRRAGQRVRITAQLVDTASTANLWADKFEGDLDDIFSLQDELAEKVITAIEPKVRRAEIEAAARKHPESLDAYELYLRALPALSAMTREGVEEALRHLYHALKVEPSYSAAASRRLRVITSGPTVSTEASRRFSIFRTKSPRGLSARLSRRCVRLKLPRRERSPPTRSVRMICTFAPCRKFIPAHSRDLRRQKLF